MAVPFGSLVPARSRVLPQTGQILGRLAGGFTAGLEQGRMRAAEDQAPNLVMDYLEGQADGFRPQLGNLAPASTYVAGQQPQNPSMVPGSTAFNGGDAMRQARIAADNGLAPPPSAISYNFGDGTIRNQPVSTDLERVLNNAAAQAGIDSVVINSGGQAPAGSGGARTGSTRHDHGGAADLQLVVGGRPLDFTNPNDLPIIQSFVAAARANGATGFGAGTDYMGNNTLHVGFGNEAVWGAGGSSANAPEWLASAVGGAAPAAGAAPQTGGGGYQSTPSWSPPTGAERAQLRALMINPATREMGYQLAIQRMTPPAPVQPNWSLQEFNGTLYRVDANSGRAEPVIQGQQGGTEWQPFTDPATGWTGRRNVQTGDVEWNPEPMQPQGAIPPGEPPTDIQVYDYYVSQERAAGREPKSFNDWDLERRGRLGGIDPTVTEARYGFLYSTAAAELPILEETFSALSQPGNQLADLVPVIGNFLTSPQYQVALDAAYTIVQMQTYARTGAQAPPAEAYAIARTYLPELGDTPERVQQKLERIRRNVEFLRAPAGPAGQVPAAAPAPAAPAAAAPLAPGAPVDPAVIWQYDPVTNALVPVSPR